MEVKRHRVRSQGHSHGRMTKRSSYAFYIPTTIPFQICNFYKNYPLIYINVSPAHICFILTKKFFWKILFVYFLSNLQFVLQAQHLYHIGDPLFTRIPIVSTFVYTSRRGIVRLYAPEIPTSVNHLHPSCYVYIWTFPYIKLRRWLLSHLNYIIE